MSRGRPSGSRANTAAVVSDHEQVMTQVWHNLVDTLRLLPTVPPTADRDRPEGDLSKDLQQLQGDKKTLDEALEKLSMLIALRRGETISTDSLEAIVPAGGSHSSINVNPNLNAHPISGLNTASIPSVQVSTPGSTGTGPGGAKRKRRPSVSVSASPAPTPLGDQVLPSSSIASPLPNLSTSRDGRGGTPNSREHINKQKREQYMDQLPLQPGRKVAFKVPSNKGKGDQGPGGDGEEENWILATIKRCITNDRMRYEVQDFDDETVSYNTTLRNIIPLPDPTSPSHLSSHPSNLEDFPKGTQVLGLYPETTSFYRATVVAAPMPGTGMGLGVRSGGTGRPDPGAKKGVYRLSFVDDGDNVNDVDKCSVVLYPQ